MEIGEKKMQTLNEKTVSKVVCNVQKELSNDTKRPLVEGQKSQCVDLQFFTISCKINTHIHKYDVQVLFESPLLQNR